MKRVEAMRGAGFSDWQRVMREAGHDAVARLMAELDPGNSPEGRNAHTLITERLAELGLPTEAYRSLSIGELLADPATVDRALTTGEYYFVSIIPGVHLAHATSYEDVIDFVAAYHTAHPEASDQEIYLSHNGEPVMSGHIVIHDDGIPQSVHAEFTIGNFNAFHRGAHTPEIVLGRTLGYRYDWQFQGALADLTAPPEQTYPCQGSVCLTRTEICERAYDALQQIPHDEFYYLPGYYEVLLERTVGSGTRPVFIEANFSGRF